MSAPAYENSNGSYVSRAELNAHLRPIREDIAEIHADMKDVARFVAGVRALARAAAWTAAVLGGLGGFGYLIAYLITGN